MVLAPLGGEEGPKEEPLEKMTVETEMTAGITGTLPMHSHDKVTVHAEKEEITELD